MLHVRRERHLDAPRERVWDEVVAWPDGALDDVEPGRRIAWTTADGTLVEVTLDDDGEGTRVVVVEAPLERVRSIGPAVEAALPCGPVLLAA